MIYDKEDYCLSGYFCVEMVKILPDGRCCDEGDFEKIITTDPKYTDKVFVSDFSFESSYGLFVENVKEINEIFDEDGFEFTEHIHCGYDYYFPQAKAYVFYSYADMISAAYELRVLLSAKNVN